METDKLKANVAVAGPTGK